MQLALILVAYMALQAPARADATQDAAVADDSILPTVVIPPFRDAASEVAVANFDTTAGAVAKPHSIALIGGGPSTMAALPVGPPAAAESVYSDIVASPAAADDHAHHSNVAANAATIAAKKAAEAAKLTAQAAAVASVAAAAKAEATAKMEAAVAAAKAAADLEKAKAAATMSYTNKSNVSNISTGVIIQELHGYQDSFAKIENTIEGMNGKLREAEQQLVSFSGRVGKQRDRLLQAREAAYNNTFRLKGISRTAANLNASLLLSSRTYGPLKKQLADVASNASGALAAIDATTTDKNIARVQKVTDKLWSVSDPSNPDSVDHSEQRVMWMEGNVTQFNRFLGRRTNAVLVKRLRQHVEGILLRWRGSGARR